MNIGLKLRIIKLIMTYIITDPCVGTCDTACVEVCPVDCIHWVNFEERQKRFSTKILNKDLAVVRK